MNGLVAVAVVLAVTAAGCFAAAAVLQHDAVRRNGPSHAWRSTRWWTGAVVASAGAAGHATALALAPLAVVQPIGVLAVPLGVLFERRAGGRAGNVTAVAWAVAGVVGGVALFTLATTAAAGTPRPPADGWRVLTAALLVAVPAVLLAAAPTVASRVTGPARGTSRRRDGAPTVDLPPPGPGAPRAPGTAAPGPQPPARGAAAPGIHPGADVVRGALPGDVPGGSRPGARPAPRGLTVPTGRSATVHCLARAIPAAVAFGLVSAIVRAGIEIVRAGPDASVGWLAAVGVAALVAGGLGVQSAFRAGPPSLVVACLTVVDPLAAVGLGAVALDERIATGPGGALVAVTGGLLAVGGVLLLARHHPDVVARRAAPNPTDPDPDPRRPRRPFPRRRP